MDRNPRWNKMPVSSLLLVEAGQLLPNILICGVKSSVDFLQAQKMIKNQKSAVSSFDLQETRRAAFREANILLPGCTGQL